MLSRFVIVGSFRMVCNSSKERGTAALAQKEEQQQQQGKRNSRSGIAAGTSSRAVWPLSGSTSLRALGSKRCSLVCSVREGSSLSCPLPTSSTGSLHQRTVPLSMDPRPSFVQRSLLPLANACNCVQPMQLASTHLSCICWLYKDTCVDENCCRHFPGRVQQCIMC